MVSGFFMSFRRFDYSANFLFNTMCKMRPTTMRANEPPNTALSLIAALPVKKTAIKITAPIIT